MEERTSPRGEATRERILEAARDTLREEGLAGTTARAIAARGGFNQALIFYHFDSVPNLLLEAFARTSAEQVERYREAARDVTSLSDLVGVARRLHEEEAAEGGVTAVTQLMAAAVNDPELGRTILDRFDDWIRIVEEALDRASQAQPMLTEIPRRQAAYAISAMFLGIELLTRLDPDRAEAPAVFDMMSGAAHLIEALGPMISGLMGQAPPTERPRG